ncbi:YdjY domain-containing protein [Dissulfurispira sp.]|uniref:YdjY domain-containing protein n=1 Tax=Dissulfurispira sp. TaxID=2817609 RepID=UPI002FD9D43C
MKTFIKSVLILLVMVIAFITGNKAFALDNLPTKENPLFIDKKNKQVLIYTEINAMHLYQPAVHWGVVFKDGRFGDRAILKAYCNQLDFHDALIQIGAKPGNSLTKESAGKHVEGDELIATAIVSGQSKELPLSDIFYDSSGKGFKIKFGGNRTASMAEKTGCITCLESCWISITSNAAYPMTSPLQRFISPNSQFRGKLETLPAKEGHPVILIYRLANKGETHAH